MTEKLKWERVILLQKLLPQLQEVILHNVPEKESVSDSEKQFVVWLLDIPCLGAYSISMTEEGVQAISWLMQTPGLNTEDTSSA